MGILFISNNGLEDRRLPVPRLFEIGPVLSSFPGREQITTSALRTFINPDISRHGSFLGKGRSDHKRQLPGRQPDCDSGDYRGGIC